MKKVIGLLAAVGCSAQFVTPSVYGPARTMHAPAPVHTVYGPARTAYGPAPVRTAYSPAPVRTAPVAQVDNGDKRSARTNYLVARDNRLGGRSYKNAASFDVMGAATDAFPNADVGPWAQWSYADGYAYNLEGVERQIDHLWREAGITGEPVDRDALWELERSADSFQARVDAGRSWGIATLPTYTGGSVSYNTPEGFFDLAGHSRYVSFRAIEREIAEDQLDRVYDDYYAGNAEWKDVRNAERNLDILAGEESSQRMNMYNAFVDDSPFDEGLFAIPFYNSASLRVDVAYDDYYDAVDAWYDDRSESTARELEIAELGIDAAQGIRMVRTGELIGDPLLTTLGWLFEGTAANEINHITEDYYHDDYYYDY